MATEIQRTVHDTALLRYIDLFCGMGSFHYSFKQLGAYQCVMACDIYKPAKENYKKNYNMDVLGDIRDIDPAKIEAYDILCAGFPCFVGGTRVLTYNGYKFIEDVGQDDAEELFQLHVEFIVVNFKILSAVDPFYCFILC